jgi:hypothetical protein
MIGGFMDDILIIECPKIDRFVCFVSCFLECVAHHCPPSGDHDYLKAGVPEVRQQYHKSPCYVAAPHLWGVVW